MQEIDFADIKQLALNILKDVAEFCDHHDIKYALAYGTMLGAVRHEGFIPWDDDIDIMMPREDYNRFIQLYNDSNSRYKVFSIETDNTYTYTMAKVFDQDTLMIDNTLWRNFDKAGVFVDIFPVDGLPESKSEQQALF